MADFTTAAPAGRQIIQSYGEGRFRIAGESYRGSVQVFPDRTLPWPVETAAALSMESLAPFTAADAGVEILLIGMGADAVPLDPGLRSDLRAAGIVADAMTTGAACRTFNVLLAEDRRVAAALIAIG